MNYQNEITIQVVETRASREQKLVNFVREVCPNINTSLGTGKECVYINPTHRIRSETKFILKKILEPAADTRTAEEYYLVFTINNFGGKALNLSNWENIEINVHDERFLDQAKDIASKYQDFTKKKAVIKLEPIEKSKLPPGTLVLLIIIFILFTAGIRIVWGSIIWHKLFS